MKGDKNKENKENKEKKEIKRKRFNSMRRLGLKRATVTE